VAESPPFENRQRFTLLRPSDLKTTVAEESAKSQRTLYLEDELVERVRKSRQVALQAAEAGMEKKALAVEIIDVVGKVDYADFLVVMTGTSDRHCGAIADSVDQFLSQVGNPPLSTEGKGEWFLLDFFDVVVHVFSESARDLYDLSGLWMDAGRVPVPDRVSAAAGLSSEAGSLKR
jgi:ribosome-associated protein